MKREEFYAARRLYRSQVSAIRFQDGNRSLPGSDDLFNLVWINTPDEVKACSRQGFVGRQRIMNLPKHRVRTALWINTRYL